MTQQRRLLIATDEATKFWGLVQVPPGFEAVRTSGWVETVDAVMYTRFDVVVVTYPFSNQPFRLFVHAVRSRASSCRHAGLVVLTTPDQKNEAAAFVGKGVNRVISVDDSRGLHSAIAEVIDVSPRASARLMVHLQMALGEGQCRIRTFSRNISESGMLLGTTNQLEVGTQFDFEFTVPGSDATVSGRAEVVRQAPVADGEGGGVGIRFVSLSSGGREALSSFLGQVLTEEVGGPPE